MQKVEVGSESVKRKDKLEVERKWKASWTGREPEYSARTLQNMARGLLVGLS